MMNHNDRSAIRAIIVGEMTSPLHGDARDDFIERIVGR